MCVYICIYVYMYIYNHMQTYTDPYICIHICLIICKHTNMAESPAFMALHSRSSWTCSQGDGYPLCQDDKRICDEVTEATNGYGSLGLSLGGRFCSDCSNCSG